MKRSANLIALVACVLWGALFLMGRDLVYGVYGQSSGAFPNAGQIDYYMVFPAAAVSFVGACAWAANALQRWFRLLGIVSAVGLFALLPYMLVYTGGI